jgi:hypothetical protein
MVFAIDTERLQVPVPDSTTILPGLRPSLAIMIEISGVYKIYVLYISEEVYK